VLAGHTTIGAGSELKVEALTSAGEPSDNIGNQGTISVGAGGTS
jgi:hypothetical protein